MVKVRVIKRYSDVVLRKIQEVGTVLDVDERRAAHLIKEGVAEDASKKEKEKIK